MHFGANDSGGNDKAGRRNFHVQGCLYVQSG